MSGSDVASGTANARWVLPSGAAARDGWQVVVDETVDGWVHTALYVGHEAAATGLVWDMSSMCSGG